MAGMLSDAEEAQYRAIVQQALDKSLSHYRKTTTDDGYGHSEETWSQIADLSLNIIRPSATQLQLWADIIGSQRALLIRVMDDADVQEGDHIDYSGLTWLVQNIQDTESYTWTKEFLITVIS
jgi:hypothetical protein